MKRDCFFFTIYVLCGRELEKALSLKLSRCSDPREITNNGGEKYRWQNDAMKKVV